MNNIRSLLSNSSSIVPLNLEVETTDSLTAVAGHICVSYRGCLICWGGYCFDEREINYRETNWLYILPYILCGEKNNIWIKIQCETNLQLRPNSGATAGVHKDILYIFGGCLFDEIHRRLTNTSTLLAIDLRTGVLSPKSIPQNGKMPTPRDKTSSWIADDKFFIFGGYGMSWYRLGHGSNQQYFFQPQYFCDDDMGTCWNNQLIYYDLIKECWAEKEQGGKRPSARAAAASVHAEEINQVFIFGGRHNQSRLNDLYCLDLGSFVWTQLDETVDGLSDWLPIGRSWCSMTLLNRQRKILCYGGLCSRGQSLCDLWELDINELYNQKIQQQKQLKSYIKQQNTDEKKHFWRQIPPLEHRLPSRLWHCSVLMGEEAILIYGGMNEAPSRESPFVHTLLVYRISPPSLRQLALNALASTIVERWITQTTTTKIDNNKKSNLHLTCSTSKSPHQNCILSSHNNNNHHQSFLDLQTFADTIYFSHLPNSLHSHLRVLLCIRRRSKALKYNNGGGNTPRDSSPSHFWHPSPVPQNFHLLNLDGIVGDESDLSDVGEDGEQRHRRNPRNFPPLSPMSQKRALADELLKLICENGGKNYTKNKLPFLQKFFNNFDLK
uniref:Uncharacterized protein n=1 Tax=Meloidogyne incognita TaxID=6306 RepID=A0A914L7Q0_MELIC